VTPDVEEKWKSTAEFRTKGLYDDANRACQTKTTKRKTPSTDAENDTSVPDKIASYYDDYKVLKCPTGYRLVSAPTAPCIDLRGKTV